MREPKAAWLVALRGLEGCADAELRWNVSVGRWEFILRGADGIPRSQFYGWFHRPVDPVTGMHPFRELDDEGMREVIRNLERSYLANRWDGAGSTGREVRRRVRFNRELLMGKYRAASEAFADMAAERGHRLRGAALIHVPVYIGK